MEKDFKITTEQSDILKPGIPKLIESSSRSALSRFVTETKDDNQKDHTKIGQVTILNRGSEFGKIESGTLNIRRDSNQNQERDNSDTP